MVHDICHAIDIMPTLLALSGAVVPQQKPIGFEGVSLLGSISGKEADSDPRSIFWNHNRGRAVRKGDWKLIKYDVMDGTVRQTQLFNVKENPNEFLKEHRDAKTVKLMESTLRTNQVNLAHDPKYADKLAEMEALLLSEMRRLNDPYRLWNQPDDGLTHPSANARKKNR